MGNDQPNQVEQEPVASKILYTDEAEYYYVCSNCYYEVAYQQWSGSTHGFKGWRERAVKGLEEHIAAGKPCEWCGTEHGGGGWQESSATTRQTNRRLKLGWKWFRECACCHKLIREVLPDEMECAVYFDVALEMPITCECGCVSKHVYTAWVKPDGTRKDD